MSQHPGGGGDIPIPQVLAHAADRARPILRRARPEDRQAIADQVDREARSNPVGLLVRLVERSTAGEYVPPPTGGGASAPANRPHPGADLRRRRHEAAADLAALERLAARGGDGALAGQVEARRQALADLDRQLAEVSW